MKVFRLDLNIKRRTYRYKTGEVRCLALQAGGTINQKYRVDMRRMDSRNYEQSNLPEAECSCP